MADGIVFINSSARTVLNVRQREVLDSHRRSHSARISHQRAQKAKEKRERALEIAREGLCVEVSLTETVTLSPAGRVESGTEDRQCWSKSGDGNRDKEELDHSLGSDSDSLISWSSALNVQPATTKLESLSKICKSCAIRCDPCWRGF